MPLPDRFTHDPHNPRQGETIEVCFTNEALANQVVGITASDGQGNSELFSIALDANGHGCTAWTVPEWDLVILTQVTSADHVIAVA